MSDSLLLKDLQKHLSWTERLEKQLWFTFNILLGWTEKDQKNNYGLHSKYYSKLITFQAHSFWGSFSVLIFRKCDWLLLEKNHSSYPPDQQFFQYFDKVLYNYNSYETILLVRVLKSNQYLFFLNNINLVKSISKLLLISF